MNNPLDLIFLRLTEAGTEKTVRLQASLIGAVLENSRGSTDVFTKLTEDGDSKVFIVQEKEDEIFDAMREAYMDSSKGMKNESE
jgi:hypothetical protein